MPLQLSLPHSVIFHTVKYINMSGGEGRFVRVPHIAGGHLFCSIPIQSHWVPFLSVGSEGPSGCIVIWSKNSILVC